MAENSQRTPTPAACAEPELARMATSASVRGPEGGCASVSLAPALFRTEHTEHLPSPSDHTTAPTTHRARARATRARGLATPAHAHTRTTPAQEATPATVGREGEATEGRVEVVVPSEIRRVRLEEPRRLTAACGCGRETAAVTIHGQPVGIFRWEPEYSDALPEYVAGPSPGWSPRQNISAVSRNILSKAAEYFDGSVGNGMFGIFQREP